MRNATYFLLMEVVIIVGHRQNLQETKVLLNMAYQTATMPPTFCNMSSKVDFDKLTLQRAVRMCTGQYLLPDTHLKGIDTILQAAGETIHDLKNDVLDSNIKLSNGFYLKSSSEELKTLSLRQLVTLRKYSPKALILLQPFKEILDDLKGGMSKSEFDDLTVELMLQKYGSLTTLESDDMVESWFGNTSSAFDIDVRTLTFYNISQAVNTTYANDVRDLTVSDAIFTVLSTYSATQMMFLPLKLVKRICYPYAADSLLRTVRETCVSTSMQNVVPYDQSDKYSLSQLDELFGSDAVDNMDYVTMKLHVNDVASRTDKILDWPLSVAACSIGVKPDTVGPLNILKLTRDILNKLTDVKNINTDNVLRGILGISDYTVKQLQYKIDLLIMVESAIANVKQFSTLSMKTIFAILDGRVSKQTYINKDLPKYLKLVTQYNITFLQKCYGFNFNTEIKKKSTVGIIKDLFGVTEPTIEDYFNINIQSSPYLNETDTFAKVQSVIPKNINTKKGALNDRSLYDALMNAACTTPPLISFLKITPLSTPTKLGGDATNMTLMKHFVVGNEFDVSISELEAHITCVYYQYEFLPPVEISIVFANYDIRAMGTYYGINFLKRKWLDVIGYVQKDVAFVKFLDIHYSKWPEMFRECNAYKISCNMFTHFSRNSKRAREEVHNRIGILPPYDEHVADTSIYDYRRLLGLSQWDIWGKTFRKLLVNMSQEYVRLNHTLINMTILDNMILNNLTILNSTMLPLEDFFNETALIPLDRMPFYYYFGGYFKESYVELLKDLNSTELIVTKIKNKEELLFPGGGLLVLTWTELLKYFLDRVTNEDLRDVRDFRIRDRYLSTTMGTLFDLAGAPWEDYYDQPIIQAAEDVLGITRETVLRITDLKVNSHDAELLWFVTVKELEWILPEMKHNESTLYQLIQASIDLKVRAFGSSFNMLAKRSNYYEPDNNDTSYIDTVVKLSDWNKDETFLFLDQRVLPHDTEKNDKEMFHMSLLKRTQMAYFSEEFNQSSVLSLADGIWKELNRCGSAGSSYCNTTYGPSLCQDKQLGYGTECVCVYGYKNYGFYCRDVNECMEQEHSCLPYIECNNTMGTFECPGECETYCPSDSNCIKVHSGPACRCPGSMFYDHRTKKCKDGDAFIYVGAVSFRSPNYLVNYGPSNSSAATQLSVTVETEVLTLLKSTYSSISAVRTMEGVGAGAVAFILFLTGSPSQFPEPDKVVELLMAGIKDGTTLERLDPALNSSLSANKLEKCLFERPLQKNGPCYGEETRICKNRNCPTNSRCVNLFTGIHCRCDLGKFLEGRGYLQKCTDGQYYIRVNNLCLPNEHYEEVYNDATSKQRLEYMMFIENDILFFMKQKYPSIVAVQVITMRRSDKYQEGSVGGVVVDILLIFKPSVSNQVIPGVDAMDYTLKDAARYRYFGSLTVCLPDSGKCAACAATFKGSKSRCDVVFCAPAQEAYYNDNPGIYIGIPVTIMILILIVIIYLVIRSKDNKNRVGII